MKTLALFDFDHTLYKGDTMIDFTKYVAGKQFYKGMFKLLPWLVGLKLGLLHNQKVKEKFLSHFFKGMEVKEFESLGRGFAYSFDRKFNKLLMIEMFDHLLNKDEVLIVTASLPQWITPWSKPHRIKLIGSTAETVDGVLTGKLEGLNCYGPEKVNRIKATLDLSQYDRIIVYGSGKGDREMLSLAR